VSAPAVPAPLAYVPNALTVVRLALIPVFAVVLFSADGGYSWPAAILFAVAGVSDQLDGWLARRWHVESAFGRVAEHLARHPKVRIVHYPGLPSHPQHALAKKQMRGFGAMMSFELGSFENAGRFLERLKVCSLGESLGGVETLISHPASMTHGSIPEEERNRLGVTPGLVRISVGIEDVDDLIADLDQALEAI